MEFPYCLKMLYSCRYKKKNHWYCNIFLKTQFLEVYMITYVLLIMSPRGGADHTVKDGSFS